MVIFLGIATIILLTGWIITYILQSSSLKELKNQLSTLNKNYIDNEVTARQAINENQQFSLDKEKLEYELEEQKEKNFTILSQKKSSETRLGQITEQLVPFLDGFDKDPKELHFLGNPIDFLHFNWEQGAITFIEIKSGNAKKTKRQILVKNIIKTGRVFFEEYRVNKNGLTKKKAINE